MLAINCLFLSRAHDRNKGKTQKVSKGLSVRKFTQTCTCRNSWVTRDVTKNQTKKLSILLSFYFHEVLQCLNIFT